MGDGGGSFCAPTAILNEGGDDNFRIPIRREAHKPRVVLELLAAQPRLFADNLSRPGFSRHVKPFDLRAVAGTARSRRPTSQSLRYPLWIARSDTSQGLRRRQSELLQFLRIHQMGLLQPTRHG